jgi:hypothetical protein
MNFIVSFSIIYCILLVSFFRPIYCFESDRIKRHVLKKIDENPQRHTKKTTSRFSEQLPTDSFGLRAKRQDDGNFQTDFTFSTAYDEGSDVIGMITRKIVRNNLVSF